jgi:hypothetical protein
MPDMGACGDPHYKEAQRLNRRAGTTRGRPWALSDAEKDYGTSFMKEVQKLNGKPYYAPRKLHRRKNVMRWGARF